jgi:protein-L-isoaspartate(D-aspartate) O-methyltransferase
LVPADVTEDWSATMTGSPARRAQLVATLRERDALHDERVAAAFHAVPRELFVPGVALDEVYRDQAIVTKREDGVGISSSSQPAIMAIMLEQLDPFPGARVLEIGAGTGYNAALLRELAGPSGRVVTLDIDAEVAGWARERLAQAGYADVLVVCADGADGWPGEAPYDRVELTVGAADIAPAWAEQLCDGGVLVLPLSVTAGQISVAFEKRGTALHSRSVQLCGFMRIRGKLAGGDQLELVAPGVVVGAGDDRVDPALVGELLATTPHGEDWDGRPWDGFFFYAGLWGLPVAGVFVEDGAMPDLGRGGLALLDPAGPSLALVVGFGGGAARLLTYGGTTARNQLLEAFGRWQALGRPNVAELQITARRLEHAPRPGPDEIPVDTRHWRLGFRREGGM